MAEPVPTTHDEGATGTVWWTLRVVFGIVPIVAGLDKFTNLLTSWEHYVAPAFARMLPISPHGFMYVVGVIEIVAGIGVLLTPWTKIFAWIVAIWLFCIAINLIAAGFYDIAVRDLVMAVTSFCLARLTATERAVVRRGAMIEARNTP
ncbi:MAG: DoxX family membrane protein [Myxococcales bacterium]